MTNPFRVVFIGTGYVAGFQLQSLKQIEGVELLAAADVNDKSLLKVKEMFGIQRCYTDYREMLAEMKEADAVSVCTPNALHAEHAIAALQAGKHVLVEKPMAIDSQQARRMVDVAAQAQRHLVVGFQHRFAPHTRLIRGKIAEGQFGSILYARCQWLRRRGIANWGVFGRKELQGGGPLIDLGVHLLEVTHYMLGSPTPVTATGSTFRYIGDKPCAAACEWPSWDYRTYTVEDLAVGMIRFDNGAMLTIETSFAAHVEKEFCQIQIMGEKAGAVWDPPRIYCDQDGYMMNMAPAYLPKGDFQSLQDAKMMHFVSVCRGERQNEASGEDGFVVQKMIDGIYASSEARKEVAIQ
jgi:predicted dehydrogenase